MAIDYVMPKLAMAMNEGTINEWLVKEGDFVEKGADLASIETEKVSYDVESPESGYIHIIVPAGETVDCEVVVACFAASEEELAELQARDSVASPGVAVEAVAPVAATAESAAVAHRSAPEVVTTGGRIKASPLARKLASLAELELSAITGTGPGGRIVKRDVLAAQQKPAALAAAPSAGDVLARIPIQGMRRTIGQLSRPRVRFLSSAGPEAASP